MPLVWGIVFYILGMAILYLVIKAAINGSDLAADARRIRNLLEEQYIKPGKDEEEQVVPEEEITVCPACGGALSRQDKECPGCGLAVR